MSRYVIARADDFPPGTRRIVEIDGRSIGVFNVDGTYYAPRNSCPHQGAPLCTGTVLASLTSSQPGDYRYEKGRRFLQCPWHGWEFDLASGQSWFDPARTRVRPYEVMVESGRAISGGGDGRVPGPYTVETLLVTVDDDYVVITP
jgi:nitrite reductase/ring-hydroxylating ferredoxin subunit